MKKNNTAPLRSLVFSLGALMPLLFSQCNKQVKSGVEAPSPQFTKIDTLRSNYLALNDSLVMSWNNMTNDDNEKFSNLKRLLEEVSYTNTADTVQIASFSQRLKDLRGMRYDQNTMRDSDLIDRYDFASINLVNEIITFAMDHPDYDRYPLMDQLVNEIRESETNVLRFRINYDLFAKDYNQFLEEHKAILDEIENNVSHRKKPLFERPHEEVVTSSE